MDTALALEYAKIGGIALGGVLALAIVVLVCGAVFRTLASYSAEKAKAAAKRAAADAERAASDAKSRIAREEAESHIRIVRAKENGLLQQAMEHGARSEERVRDLERNLAVITAERDALIARLTTADTDRQAERAAIAAAVVDGMVAAVKSELLDCGPGTAATAPPQPPGFTADPSRRASSWQDRATIPADRSQR